MSETHSSTTLLDPPENRPVARPAPRRPKRRSRIVVPIVIVVVIVLVIAFVVVRRSGSGSSALLTSTATNRTVSLTAQGTGTVVDPKTVAIGTDNAWTITEKYGVSIAAAGQGPREKVASVRVGVGSVVKKGEVLATVENVAGDISDITTPAAGVIRTSAASKRSSVAGTLFTVGVGAPQVSVPISEYEIGKVAVGQSVSVDLQGLGETVTGAVVSTDPPGSASTSASSSTSSGTSSDSSTVTDYPVIVSVPNPPRTLRLGMNAQATIAIKKLENVLAVPVQALSESSSGKYTLTTVTTNRRSTVTKVTAVGVGLVGDSYAQITSGLSKGDKVVTGTAAASTTSTTTPTGPRF